ncbi:MAG: hypothetical protein A3I66_23760 [Burkholderiales bacterium RIFCSPLOWO2_02_FULL_57_36]|nr:MAG: hypothetical protein A3I66_23760 [Burkholderiales bacterium RIFCSPLOWO2_02_FULL_57_36]
MKKKPYIYLTLVFGVLALMLLGGFGAYRLGVAVGENKAADSVLTSKLTSAYLVQSIDFLLRSHEAIEGGDTKGARKFIELHLADSLRQIIVGAEFDTSRTGMPNVLCKDIKSIERVVEKVNSQQLSKDLVDQNEREYIVTTFSASLKALHKSCSSSASGK